MNRGDLVLVREAGSPASKPRPCVVVQRDSALATTDKVTVCPLTSRLKGARGQRPFVAPNAANGLHLPSEVEIDWIFTHPVGRIGGVVGHLDEPTMNEVDRAMRRWLDL